MPLFCFWSEPSRIRQIASGTTGRSHLYSPIHKEGFNQTIIFDKDLINGLIS